MPIKDKRAVYAGSQLQAAGILLVADNTQLILTVLRSARVADPSLWCGAGGKIELGETPSKAARREIAEELGYTGDIEMYPAYIFENESLKFHNFIGLVPTQFIPKLNWESDGYAWTSLDKIPDPQHYGLKALLADKESSSILNMILSWEY